jgi:hypothetical protein
VVRDHAEQDGLDERSEPAALGVGTAELALEQPAGKVLEQVGGGLRVAEDRDEVAADGLGVAVEGFSRACRAASGSLP